jgi:catechol 2,3-dioxygenase-like lactoylglutathione lyase family enzyme
MKINDIAIFVKDLKKSIEFYKKVGFKTGLQDKGFCEFKMEGTKLALLDYNVAADLVGRENTPQSKKHGFLIAQEVPEIDNMFKKLKSKGIRFFKEPKTQSWGQRTAYFKDPDGNIWEIYTWVKKE